MLPKSPNALSSNIVTGGQASKRICQSLGLHQRRGSTWVEEGVRVQAAQSNLVPAVGGLGSTRTRHGPRSRCSQISSISETGAHAARNHAQANRLNWRLRLECSGTLRRLSPSNRRIQTLACQRLPRSPCNPNRPDVRIRPSTGLPSPAPRVLQPTGKSAPISCRRRGGAI